MYYLDSIRFKQIAQAIADAAYPACIDLCVVRYAEDNLMIHTMHPQGDAYITASDLQSIANDFCDINIDLV